MVGRGIAPLTLDLGTGLEGSDFRPKLPHHRRKNPPLAFEYEAGWIPETLHVLMKRKNFFHLLGIEPCVIQPVA
jgi:hypothetical protein